MKGKLAQAPCNGERLTLYHYGELDAAECRRVEEHLGRCADCRRELERLRALLTMLPRERRDFSPDEIRAFNRRVGQRSVSRRRSPAMRALGWSAAGAAALALVMMLIVSPEGLHRPGGEVALQERDRTERLPDPLMLLELELLENLDLLQELEGAGGAG